MNVPRSRHPREVAHEDGLLADLAGLAVDERDRDGQRPGVREVLLAALVERGDRIVEDELAELHGEVAGVVLDRRDVVDRLPQTTVLGVGEPGKGLLLDVDQVGYIKGLRKTRETTARPGGVNRCQDGDSSGSRRASRGCAKARPAKIAHGIAALCWGLSALTDPARKTAYVARSQLEWAAATIGRPRQSSADPRIRPLCG